MKTLIAVTLMVGSLFTSFRAEALSPYQDFSIVSIRKIDAENTEITIRYSNYNTGKYETATLVDDDGALILAFMNQMVLSKPMQEIDKSDLYGDQREPLYKEIDARPIENWSTFRLSFLDVVAKLHHALGGYAARAEHFKPALQFISELEQKFKTQYATEPPTYLGWDQTVTEYLRQYDEMHVYDGHRLARLDNAFEEILDIDLKNWKGVRSKSGTNYLPQTVEQVFSDCNYVYTPKL